MDLVTLRPFVAKELGRYDLVNTDDSDNGMNLKINTAFRVLDMMLPQPSNRRTCEPIVVSIDDRFVEVPNLRKPDYVYYLENVSDPNPTRVYFEYMSPDDVRRSPTHYEAMAPRPPYRSPQIQGRYYTMASISETVAAAATGAYKSLFIEIIPAATEALALLIDGIYFTPDLVNDTDVNFWSQNHPQAESNAEGYVQEAGLRNTEGRNDWMSTLKEYFLMDRNFANDRDTHISTELGG